MDENTETDLVHSVAFRVTETQWLKLQHHAQQEGTTIPQLAKAAVFEKIGIETSLKGRRSYGQATRRKSE